MEDTEILTLPKAELHLHIEGAAPPALVARLAAARGVDLGDLIDGDRYRWRDFTEFLAAYDAASAVFRTPEDFAALAEAYLAKNAAQGVIYTEIFAAPDIAATLGLSIGDYIGGLAEGIARAKDAHSVEARIIPLCVRHLGPDAARKTAEQVAKLAHPLVTGWGMAGDERVHHPRDFAPAFDAAREAGLGLTAHAGEFGGPDSVRAALDHLRVDRIGHGVRAIEDADLVARLADEGVTLEVCPLSNVALGVYSRLEDHPFARLRDSGVKVTLSTDDPPFFSSDMAAEYAAAHRVFGLDADALRDITRTALDAAFCDAHTRDMLKARV